MINYIANLRRKFNSAPPVDDDVKFVIKTTSTSATWKASAVSNSGETMNWEVSGGASGSYTGNQPEIDLTGNVGTAIITVTGLSDITLFRMYFSTLYITSFEAYNVPNLTRLDVINNTTLTTFITENLPSLITLYCYNNRITSLDVSNLSNLTDFQCYGNSTALTEITLLNNTNLSNFNCNGHANLTTLDVSSCTELTVLNTTSCSGLTSIDFGTIAKVLNLQLSVCSLTTLDLSNMPLLHTIRAFNNSISTLDISNNPLLKELWIYGNNQSATQTDDKYDVLASNGVLNGNIRIRNNRTVASDVSRAILVTNGWTFYETYTT